MVTDFVQIFTYLKSIRKQNSFTFADRLAGFLKQIKQSFDTVQHMMTNLYITLNVFSSPFSHFLCYDWNITWFTLCNGWYLASIYTHSCCYWDYYNHITQEHVLSCSCYLQVRNIGCFVLFSTVFFYYQSEMADSKGECTATVVAIGKFTSAVF